MYSPANVDMTVVVEHIPDLIVVAVNQVLDIYLLFLVPGEGCVQCQHSAVDEAFQLFTIDVVYVLVATAKVQDGFTNWLT